MIIYTIGHSTLDIADFIKTLQTYKVDTLIDVRSLPGSKYVPAFNQENLIENLKKNNIKYIHLLLLGGRKKSGNKSHHDLVNGWKNASFRNYASYTLTDKYAEGISKLIELSKNFVCAIMCAESVPWRCHRSIIANTLVHLNIKVIHIMDRNKIIEHKLNLYGAKSIIKNNILIYPNGLEH